MEATTVAVYLDFENLAISAETAYPSRDKPLALEPLVDYLTTKGIISLKKAYADWSKDLFSQYQQQLMEQGFELVHLPSMNQQGKNGADVRLAIDVMDALFSGSEVRTVVIGSGDTDFIPLIQRVRARGREVIILGFEHSVGYLVKRNCTEFKSLEDLIGKPEAGSPSADLADDPDSGYGRQLLLRFIKTRDNEEPVLMANLKQQLLRLDPTFSEREAGFASFKQFIQSFEGDLVEKIEALGSTMPVVYLQNPEESTEFSLSTSREKAQEFLSKKLRYLHDAERRMQMCAALYTTVRSQEAISMNQMVEAVNERTQFRLPKSDIKKFVNTLYTGQAFLPSDTRQQGPLLSRPFRLEDTLQSPEAMDQLYIRRVSEILQSRYPDLEAGDILELLI
ncbi:MAG: NYN domain-containing protein [Bacteroidia bacterium]|nr:NYN domain-containing protein [Bacteroidia bacterium]